MYQIALTFGVVTYLVFILGLLGKLTKNWLLLSLLIWFFCLAKETISHLPSWKKWLRKKKSWLVWFALGLFFCQIGLNVLNLLTPEIAFDALWYHLTLPKLYLQEKKLDFFTGGLLYYSAMPQAMEMLYLLGLEFGGQVLARSFHFLFGILSSLVVYQLGRKFVKSNWALLGGFIFYSQLVVAWLSSAAYVDLTRTFLEILGFLAILQWFEKRETKWLIKSGIILGLAVIIKLLSLMSVLVLFSLICFYSGRKIKDSLIFLSSVLITSCPWFLYGAIKTGTIFYPFLTAWFWKTQTADLGLWNWLLTRTPLSLIKSFGQTSFSSGDILTPLFLISLPWLILRSRLLLKDSKKLFLLIYFSLNFLVWFFIPLNYNRFLLPYTPFWIILILIVFEKEKINIQKIFLGSVLVIALIHLGTRGILSQRSLNFLIQRQSLENFLEQNLPENSGTLIDRTGFLKENVNFGEKVLIINSHNLFYVPVAFDHYSWAQADVKYKYLVVQNQELPKKWENLPLIHQDKQTALKIYLFEQTLEDFK